MRLSITESDARIAAIWAECDARVAPIRAEKAKKAGLK